MSPTASEVIVKRYDIQDAEGYTTDHRHVWGGSFFSGMGIAVAAVAVCCLLFDPMEVAAGALVCSAGFTAYAGSRLYRLYQGGNRA